MILLSSTLAFSGGYDQTKFTFVRPSVYVYPKKFTFISKVVSVVLFIAMGATAPADRSKS